MELQVKGLDALIRKMDKLAAAAKTEVQAELNDWADTTAQNAKSLVSANSSDEGMLLRSINPNYGNGYASVTASAIYAAYVEFGTRKYAAAYVSSLPADWQAYAATFKGSTGGTFREFVKSLMAWGSRTGKMDPKYAYVTALKILREGVKARPFLYPSVQKTLPVLKKNLRAIFKL
ncbi:Bacteriophage HK97-gp10, putative tail-component [uncultured Caudovirales phage]|uniref:Bacteriophage HK97-gp10, putative tail-component n=1 Tax=uncultured Caudovirales phage TaxID=2100421 RepID=A0A6J5MDN8_9CAUD|nr:Bacteriophage HK97-gp10, putative tail-component [uncultured Caudovirales phage]